MTHDARSSLIIVGGGITGLTLAVAAQVRGHAVTIVAAESPETTASGVAAGMIAPVQEALVEPDPVLSFQRLKAVQAVWDSHAWPAAVAAALRRAKAASSLRLAADPAIAAALTDAGAEIEVGEGGFLVFGDWLVDAPVLLAALTEAFAAAGGCLIATSATGVSAHTVTTASETLTADAVVVAAGYGAHAFAGAVPSLAVLEPIKGQLLEIKDAGAGTPLGVVRSKAGYWARSGQGARFGASMQPGRSDLTIDPEVTAHLQTTLEAMIDGAGEGATPRVGVRASTPDGWPLIGRDGASGVYVATGMRRNGYVFAPFAARRILDLIDGVEAPAADPYAPDRFR